MTSSFAHYHREIIHFKRLQNFRNAYFFLFKALYLFKIYEQTPFFEQYVIDNYDKIQQLLHSGVDFD